MSEDALRKSLAGCNVCNAALVDEIHERIKKGEKVNTICKDLEEFQRQLHGEPYYSANALRQRYRTAIGEKYKSGLIDQNKLKELASDPEVQQKLERAAMIPDSLHAKVFLSEEQEKEERKQENAEKNKAEKEHPFNKIVSKLQAVATISAQHGHGLSESERKTVHETLFLIFRNTGGENE